MSNSIFGNNLSFYLDSEIYKLYNLTPEEIKIVEGNK